MSPERVGASEGPRRQQGSAQLELCLTIRASGSPSDVVLKASPAARLRDTLATVVPMLSERGPAAARLAAASERRRAWLELDRPISASSLTHGDTIHVGSFADISDVVSTDAPPPNSVEVWVHGGPRAGERFVLSTGSHIFGRDRQVADVEMAEDASLSRRHFELTVDQTRVTLTDLGSANGSFVDGARVTPNDAIDVPTETLIEAGRSSFSWRAARSDATRIAGGDGLIVRRPPRVRNRWAPPLLDLDPPPDDPRRARIPVLASVVPLAMGVVLAVLINPAFLLIAVLAPILALASRLEDRVTGAADFRKRRREFGARLEDLAARLSEAVREEAEARRADAPDAAAVLRRVTEPSGELWARRNSDDDYLALRIGSADQPSATTVTFGTGGNAALRAEADAEIESLRVARSVPVLVRLAEQPSLGIVGPSDGAEGLARWLVIQAAVFHSPAELSVRAMVAPAGLQAWDWLKWLPHTRREVAASNLVVGEDAAHELIDSVLASLPANPAAPAGRSDRPASLWIVDGALTLDPRRVARLLDAASAGAIAVIWLAGDHQDLPDRIAAIARVDPQVARLTLVSVPSGTTIEATADGVSRAVAEQAARDLAPLVDPTASALGQEIPRVVSLLGLLDGELSDEWLDARWANPRPETSLGATAQGAFTINLPRDGPHALIGGTTGSGKSELLQSLVAGLALTNPPSRMSFLLIDYKGGAAFRECVELPHVTGLVTDLDDHLARRALISLDAEIRRREAVLARLGARSLESAVGRSPSDAPARLIIVIDEFAALVREVPEFVDGVVDVAQRGRTLGVHLVLATQRPAGAVSREVWANTNLRVALRVADPADSLDVIGSPDAASLPADRPGRALARIGQSSPIEFQSAFVGGPPIRRIQPQPEAIPLTFGGKVPGGRRSRPAPTDASRMHPADEAERTELTTIVDATRRAVARLRLATPPPAWLPQLPDLIPLAAVTPAEPRPRLASFGLIDDPARQAQEPAVFDLARDGAMLVYGAGGTGKTTLLRTLAASLASNASAAEVQLHALDFGAGGLQSLEALPHVGSVVPGGDEERVMRLVAMLTAELADRQERFARTGAPDINAYRSAATDQAPLPSIVLLLDGYGAFAANYERVEFGRPLDLIARLAADGRAVGLHVVVTADRRGNVPSRLAGVVARRVILRVSDESEYGQHGIDRRAYQGLPALPGRGLTESGLEIQVAVTGDQPTPAGQAEAIRAIGDAARKRFPDLAAPAIGVLPAEVAAADLGEPGAPGRAILGKRDRDLARVIVDLNDGHLLVAGPLRSGRSAALGTIARSLRSGDPDLTLHLLAPRRTPLVGLDIWTSVVEGIDACDALVNRVATEQGGATGIGPVLVIDDGEELFESGAASALATLARKGRDTGLRVLAAVELRSALRAYGGWLAELRKDRHGLLLQPGQEMAGELLGATLPRSGTGARPMPPGRGYLIVRGGVEVVQVAR